MPPAQATKIPRAEMEDLLKRGQAGDPEAFRKFCSYVIARDLYDVSEFEVTEDLQSACAELRPVQQDE
jgi:hypothetical protein